jgi:hypothetical protein
MKLQIPTDVLELADRQRGLLTWQQATSAGVSKDVIRSRIEHERWQRVHTGVYAIHSGSLDREATLWAAVLRAGAGAALSYQTAAELDRLIDRPAGLIHVTIPDSRRVTPIDGVVIHTSSRAERAMHPVRLPPRTRIEQTVLDLASQSRSVDDAVGWATAALGRGLTTQRRLREALASRSRVRWRNDLGLVLSPDLAGIHSVLEYRYFRYVERPHHLPKGKLQAQITRNGRHEYRDVLYDKFAVVVELDGRVAHPGDTRWNDIRRDNYAAVNGEVTLRYGYLDLKLGACLVAVEVDQVLKMRGWEGPALPCGVGCPIGSS